MGEAMDKLRRRAAPLPLILETPRDPEPHQDSSVGEILAGLVLLSAGVIFTEDWLLALVGILSLAGSLYLLRTSDTIPVSRATGGLIMIGVTFLILARATWTWIPVLLGLALVWIGQKGGFVRVVRDRRLDGHLAKSAREFDVAISRLAASPESNQPAEGQSTAEVSAVPDLQSDRVRSPGTDGDQSMPSRHRLG